MNLGYARVSKTGGAQNLDLQYDALTAAGVEKKAIYEDRASGKKDSRPGLDACLKALREGDTLVVWKLDRLGRDLHHLVSVVQELTNRGVGLRVLAGQGAQVDTTTAAGRLVFGILAALAEFERELIGERTLAGLEAARARGRRGGRKFALSKAQVRLAQAAMQNRDTSVAELAKELRIKPVTLYRYVGPKGELRENGKRVLDAQVRLASPCSCKRPGRPRRRQASAAVTTVQWEKKAAGRCTPRGPLPVVGKRLRPTRGLKTYSGYAIRPVWNGRLKPLRPSTPKLRRCQWPCVPGWARLLETVENVGREALRAPHVRHLEGKLWELRAGPKAAARGAST